MTPSSFSQQSLAQIVAQKAIWSTQLTEICHKFLTQLLPLRSSLVNQTGAALYINRSHGGGMVQGNTNNISIDVQDQ